VLLIKQSEEFRHTRTDRGNGLDALSGNAG
jgi:hypothetical protein